MQMRGWVGQAARVVAVVLVGVLGLTTASRAQNENGSINGYVFDAQHGVVPNATVTATEKDKKVPYTATTDGQGHYSIVDVPPGTYDISVTAAGFKSFVQQEVVLHVNDKIALPDFSLTVGTVTETVTVTTQVDELDTEGAQRGDTVDNKQMENLALNGRSPLSLVTLVPGVSSNVSVEIASTIGINEFTANGVRNNSNNLTINGIGDLDTGLNGDQNVTVSQDSVQEFTIQTGIYQAQYGRSSGAQVNIITKSGTSDFHGSAYFFHRNEGLNSRTWLENEQTKINMEPGGSGVFVPKQLFRANDPGYTIGGPIYIPGHFNTHKDKLFFFWSEEFQRQFNPGAASDIWVPTAAEATGDFSADGDGAYIRDPCSPSAGCPTPNTSLTDCEYPGQLFPGSPAVTSGCFQGLKNGVPTLGVIPAAQLYGPGLAFLQLLNKALPPIGGAAPAKVIDESNPALANYNYVVPARDEATFNPRREDTLRIDYNVTGKLKLNGTWIKNVETSTNFTGTTTGGPGETAPLTTFAEATPGYQWGIGGTYIINPTLVDDFEFGVSNNSLHNPVPKILTSTGSGISFPLLFPSAVQDNFLPSITIGNNPAGGAGASIGTAEAPFLNFNTVIDVTDNISKVWGQHTFKTGVYIQRSRKDQTAFANANGAYSFSTDTNNAFDTLDGYANLAAGIFDSFNQASSFPTGKYRYTNVEGYFQDTWKVTPTLTLDLGLRLSWYQPQYDASLQTSNFYPNLFNPADQVALFVPGPGGTAVNPLDPGDVEPGGDVGAIVPGSGNLTNGIRQGLDGTSKYLVQNRPPQIGPRVGIAWDITGKGNVVIRTGAGIYFDRTQGNIVFGLIANPPVSVDPSLSYGCLNTSPAGCPTGAATVSSTNSLQFPAQLTATDPSAKIPTVYEASFGVQAKLPGGMILDTSYVGTFSYHLTDEIDLNAVPYGGAFQCQNQNIQETGQSAACVGTPTNPTCISTQTGTGYSGACALQANFLRPYPGYSDIYQNQYNGTANYNSLQVSLSRRYAHGLYLGAAYTYSKNMTDTNQGLPGGLLGYDFSPERIDGQTKRIDYTYAPFDQRQNLVINYVYEFPSVFKSGLKHAVVDGWQISGITRFGTGNPYQVTYIQFNDFIQPIGGDIGITPVFPVYFINSVQTTGSYTEPGAIALTGQKLKGSGGPFNYINPGAFVAPPIPNNGTSSPRSSAYLFAPGWNNFDMSLQKNFTFNERYQIQLRLDAFNVFNHTQVNGVNSTADFVPFFGPGPANGLTGPPGDFFLGTPTTAFGTASSVRDARELQMVARFVF
jgi:hypothetical protein